MQNRFQWVFDYYEFWNRGFGKVLSINVGDDGDIDLALGKTAIVTDLPNRFCQKYFQNLVYYWIKISVSPCLGRFEE